MYLTRKLFGERVTANFQAEQNLSQIYAERSQIDQVLWNLLVNARNEMPHGGQLLVETAFITLDNSFTATRVWARTGDFVRLSVSDTGTGMDQETIKKIFDLFFTTKGEGLSPQLIESELFGHVRQAQPALTHLLQLRGSEHGTMFIKATSYDYLQGGP
jgi:two-component system cell cycle sensor histidine kinase/response regulator CckA